MENGESGQRKRQKRRAGSSTTESQLSASQSSLIGPLARYVNGSTITVSDLDTPRCVTIATNKASLSDVISTASWQVRYLARNLSHKHGKRDGAWFVRDAEDVTSEGIMCVFAVGRGTVSFSSQWVLSKVIFKLGINRIKAHGGVHEKTTSMYSSLKGENGEERLRPDIPVNPSEEDKALSSEVFSGVSAIGLGSIEFSLYEGVPPLQIAREHGVSVMEVRAAAARLAIKAADIGFLYKRVA